jgi:NAD(P)-dependent dehydrogenase (short-subunit alcohol dehydrogenase family)
MTVTVITGANKGLGFETARCLVEAGHTVYAGARDEADAKRAAGELGALPLLIDVTDGASIQAAADHVAGEQGVLDVLVNNAGITDGERPAEDFIGGDVAAVFDTNVVGIVRATHAFLPLLRRSAQGIVVNVGSGLGSFGRVCDPDRPEFGMSRLAYAASKAAVSMLTVQYAKAFPELRVNVVDPGYTATAITRFLGTQTVAEGAAPIVRAALLTGDGPTGAFFDVGGECPW